MAATSARTGDYNIIWGNNPGVLDSFIPDAAYPTGGYAVTGQLWGLSSTGARANNGIRAIIIRGFNTAALPYFLKYNGQLGTVLVYVQATGLEVANGTDLSALVFEVLVIGTGE